MERKFLSPLEVEGLYREGENEGKEDSPPKNHGCNYSKKIVVKTEVILDISFHCLSCGNGFLYISIL